MTLGTEQRQIARNIVVVQSIAITVVACLVAAWKGTAGLSILVGGLIFILPNAYFSYRFFKHTGAQHARLIVKNFYLGELTKIVMTVIMFIAAFKSGFVQAGPLFIGYGIVLVAQWFAPLYETNLK